MNKRIWRTIIFCSIIFWSIFGFISCAGIREWKVVGNSMYPTLQNDHIYLGKNSNTSIGRGDIVFFYYKNQILVKRVIGLPEDDIIMRYSVIVVNRKLIDEPYILFYDVSPTLKIYKVPKDEFFVLGDNRVDSMDSRMFGYVKRSNIIGKVLFRIW